MGTLIRKPEHGSPEWLMLRHRQEDGTPVLSASDAAAIHGEHPYKSRVELFMEKLRPEPPVTVANDAMERGTRLEPAIREWAASKLGVELVEPEFMYATESSGTPLIATLDAAVVDEYGYAKMVVEIKTLSDWFDGTLPRHWYWQGVQQAICADVNAIIWAVLDSSLTLKFAHQEVTDREKFEHLSAVTEFAFWLRAGEPNPDWERTYDELSASYPESMGLTVDITAEQHILYRLREVQADRKLLEDEESNLKAELANLMREADTATINGKPVVTWKTQSRTGFDSKLFKEENPDLYNKYVRTNGYRVMRLKGDK